jgi:hypothetical protein
VNREEAGVAPVPPLPPPTQQSTKGSFWQVPHRQLLFSPEAMLQQQLLPQQNAATQEVQQPVAEPVQAQQILGKIFHVPSKYEWH